MRMVRYKLPFVFSKLCVAGFVVGVVGLAFPAQRAAQSPSTAPPAGAAAAPSRHGPGMAGHGGGAASGGAAIQYPADVSGQVIADLLFDQYPKPEGWQQNLQQVCRIRRDSLAEGAARLQQQLADPQAVLGQSAAGLIQLHYALAQIQAYRGDMAPAIQQWKAAYAIASQQLPSAIPQLTEVLGVAYLHEGEMANEFLSHPGERCIFPPDKPVCLQHGADFQKAIDSFSTYLSLKPQRPDFVQVEWLLNLAYMTLGKYPDGVPAAYRIPPSFFASRESVPRFTDVAPAAGLGFPSMAGGVVVDDFENNGRLDILVSSYDVCQPLRYFHNNGDGTFTDRTAHAGLLGQLGGLNMVQADYNNDGCMDVLVLRGAWEFPERKSLLRNNCDGTFTDVTQQAGLAEPATKTQTAVWTDINNDGLLDLFVGNEDSPSQLFLNKGDGTFEDISHAAGVDHIAFTKGVTAGDYDNDGYPDLFVSNLAGHNFLYHNNHNNTFQEVSEKAGVSHGSPTFATWFFDYNNDGRPDIFAAGYAFSTDETIRSYLGLPVHAGTMKLFENLGDGTFRDVSATTGLARVNVPMGANFGDFNNDGYPDIYLATGGPEYGAMAPKMLLRNNAGRSFTDVTAASGTGDLHKGHGVAFADLANDGCQDLVVSVGGATPGDAHQFRIFSNPGNGNDWLEVKLVGVKTNRSGIGSVIKVTVRNGSSMPRPIYRTVGSGGSFGASPLKQEIGLGPDAKIERLEVFWPASRSHQLFRDVRPDQLVEIHEFSRHAIAVHRKPIPLGAGSCGYSEVRGRHRPAGSR